MEIVLTFETNIYGPESKSGVSKIIKRGLKYRETINTEDIKHVREFIDTRGKILKDKTVLVLHPVGNSPEEYKTLMMPFEEAQFLKVNKQIKGFQNEDNRKQSSSRKSRK